MIRFCLKCLGKNLISILPRLTKKVQAPPTCQYIFIRLQNKLRYFIYRSSVKLSIAKVGNGNFPIPELVSNFPLFPEYLFCIFFFFSIIFRNFIRFLCKIRKMRKTSFSAHLVLPNFLILWLILQETERIFIK